MPKVHSMSVTGYKSIRSLHDFKLNNLNVLIGGNGAGKSNFISLFKFLNQIYEQNLQVYSQVQGGPDALLHFGRHITEELHVSYSFTEKTKNFYSFDLRPTKDNRLIFSLEQAGIYSCTGKVTVYSDSGHVESPLKYSTDEYFSEVASSVNSWRVIIFKIPVIQPM